MFLNRTDAGRQLAQLLLPKYSGRDDLLVLALPRGGVPVAYEVAETLDAPMDVFLVRKLGVPGQEELAMGAIASGGVLVLNWDVVEGLRLPNDVIDDVAVREGKELHRRERSYRDDLPPPDVRDRGVLLIDDGLATGASMQSAIRGLRKMEPAALICAVPVAPPASLHEIRPMVDDLVCVAAREPFYGVGYWYEDFNQTSDEEVRQLLRANRERHAMARSAGRDPPIG